MIRRTFHTLLLVLTVSLSAYGQGEYATRRLRSIGKAVGLEEASPSGTVTYQGRTLHVRRNQWNEVSHIGYPLFSDAIRQAQPSPLYDFLERYLLELDLPAEFSTSLRLEKDQVVVRGNLAMARTFDGSELFSIDEKGLQKYKIEWGKNGCSLTMAFNKDCQLLSGCDAVELELIASRNLKRIAPLVPQVIEPDTRALTAKNDSMLYWKGRTYISNYISSDLYLRRSETPSGYAIVEDPQWPAISVGNIMLCGSSQHDYIVDVKLDKYGYDTEDFTISLRQWLAFCQMEGCQLYFGVKAVEDDQVTGIVLALNPQMGYNHMLSVTFPTMLLAPDAKVAATHVKARLYAYIPLHSMTEKFFKAK